MSGIYRLYADENFPVQMASLLRHLGFDVLTARDAGQAGHGVPDERVLAYATQQGRAVVTYNRRDFFRLHQSTGGSHAGIVCCTADSDLDRHARNIHKAVHAAGELAGKVVRVYKH